MQSKSNSENCSGTHETLSATNNANNFKFSIVVPVYNKEKYLQKCISSLQGQTYGNFELLLIDNNSTDSSPEIIKAAASSDKRIVALHETVQGPSATRNCGIDAAKGDYVCFIDADDIVDNNLLAQLNAALTQAEADIAIFGISYWHEDRDVVLCTNVPKLSGSAKPENLGDELFFTTTPSMCTKAFRVAFLREHNLKVNTELKFAEDLLFTYSALMQASSIVYINKVLYKYRQEVRNSLSAKKTYQGVQILESLDLLEQKAKTLTNYDAFAVGLMNVVLEEAMFNLCEASTADEFCELYDAFITQWWPKIKPYKSKIRQQQQHIYNTFEGTNDARELLFQHVQEARTRLLWYEKQCRKLEGDIEALKASNEHKIQELTGTKAYKVGNAIMKPFCKLKDRLVRG